MSQPIDWWNRCFDCEVMGQQYTAKVSVGGKDRYFRVEESERHEFVEWLRAEGEKIAPGKVSISVEEHD